VAQPKRRTTSSKRDMRRANHDKVTPPTLGVCPNCSAAVLPHRVCPSCGHFKGKQIVGAAES